MRIFFKSVPHKVGSGAPQQFMKCVIFPAVWFSTTSYPMTWCSSDSLFFLSYLSVGNSQPRSQMTSPLLLTSHLAPFHHERNHATTHFHLAYPLQGHGRLAPIPHFLLNKTPRSHHPLWVLEMLSLQHDYLNLALSSASVNINKPQNTIQG